MNYKIEVEIVYVNICYKKFSWMGCRELGCLLEEDVGLRESCEDKILENDRMIYGGKKWRGR